MILDILEHPLYGKVNIIPLLIIILMILLGMIEVLLL